MSRREPFSLSTRANIDELHYTKRLALTREGLSNLAYSMLIQILTLRLRISANLTVKTATLS